MPATTGRDRTSNRKAADERIAFIFAFLFRAFEVEAFVIPTGSMAPTLFGRHKDVVCEQCGYKFEVGASEELKNDILVPYHRLDEAKCPNCRFSNPVRNLPVFAGDRILVNKFPYEFGRPSRWDVAVFKSPEEPDMNYIKRLVGLPNETILIRRGDLYRVEADGTEHILRKDDPNKQRRLQIVVYDNDHPERKLQKMGWPSRWAAVRPGGDGVAGWGEEADGWQQDRAAHRFHLDASNTADGRRRWIRYRHIVPDPSSWTLTAEALSAELLAQLPRPSLVSDFCNYNAFTGGQGGGGDNDFYWVGDLTLSCAVSIEAVDPKAELVLELNEGRLRFRCRLDLVAGTVAFTRRVELNRDEDEDVVLATSSSGISGTGRHDLCFANVDNRLCLWIDDRLVDFGDAAAYRLTATDPPGPTDDDLAPAGIAARGVSLSVSHLVIERDIYYRSGHQQPIIDDNETLPVDDDRDRIFQEVDESDRSHRLHEALSDPAAWDRIYTQSMAEARLVLGPKEYLMLGDNSPKSKDSRLWPNERRARHRHAVPEANLVGKAFFIYWPHGIPFMNKGRGYPDENLDPDAPPSILRRIPMLNGLFYHTEYPANRDDSEPASSYPDFRVPFYPHLSRMRRIR